MDCATSLDGKREASCGDVSLCLSCGELLEYDESMCVRQASLTTTMALSRGQLETIAKAQYAIREKRYIQRLRSRAT